MKYTKINFRLLRVSTRLPTAWTLPDDANTAPEIPKNFRKEHDEKFNTPKGEFKGEYQGYGNVDRLDEMFYPEWRT